MLTFLIQAAQPATDSASAHPGLTDRLKDLGLSSPQHLLYGYIALLFVLWFLARRGRARQKDFTAEAQIVLDEKFRKGEIDRETYEKYRQELSMRLKKD